MSEKTAISRNKLSSPMKWLRENFRIVGRALDYGCGQGYDARELVLDSFDPYYKPTVPTGLYNTITCNYVLNCLPGIDRREVLIKIYALLEVGGKAYISVRNDLKLYEQPGKGCIQYQVILGLPLIHKTGNYKMYIMRKIF